MATSTPDAWAALMLAQAEHASAVAVRDAATTRRIDETLWATADRAWQAYLDAMRRSPGDDQLREYAHRSYIRVAGARGHGPLYLALDTPGQ